MRTLLLLIALAFVAAVPSLAATQKSCRKCDCDVTITGELGFLQDPSGPDAALDWYMRRMSKTITGSIDEDPYWWTKPSGMTPGAKYPSWSGNARFYRLCGNGKSAHGQWTDQIYTKGMTTMTIDCKQCDKSVECLRGSKCQDSGL